MASSNQRGSSTAQKNFSRLANTQEFKVSRISAEGAGFAGGGAGRLGRTGPIAGGPYSMSSDETFSATGAYDKVLLLSLITLGSAVVSYALKLPIGIAFLTAIGALVCYFVTNFKPTIASTTAPLYGLLQGVTLGVLSYWAAMNGIGAVAMALMGTLGIYFGVLALYRTGWVRVTQTFTKVTFVIVMGTMFAAFGYMLLSWFGFPVLSGANSNVGTFMIFGVLYLVAGIMTLFTDFAYIDQAAASKQFNRHAEWYAALSVIISLVMIFLGLLRIFGAFGGGGGSRR